MRLLRSHWEDYGVERPCIEKAWVTNRLVTASVSAHRPMDPDCGDARRLPRCNFLSETCATTARLGRLADRLHLITANSEGNWMRLSTPKPNYKHDRRPLRLTLQEHGCQQRDPVMAGGDALKQPRAFGRFGSATASTHNGHSPYKIGDTNRSI